MQHAARRKEAVVGLHELPLRRRARDQRIPERDFFDDRSARLPSFARHHGDSIVLDDVGPVAEDVAFGDALVTGAPTERQLVEADDSLFALCGVLPAANCVRFDDFTSGGGGRFAVVPEPSTGVLVAMGLVMLALGRRSSRPFASGPHALPPGATSSR